MLGGPSLCEAFCEWFQALQRRWWIRHKLRQITIHVTGEANDLRAEIEGIEEAQIRKVSPQLHQCPP
jgi:hypothetical protein